ncbi:MAG: hypothetical protein HOE90_13070 [Bacteriovoracaceae bacterium]|nr:hypothetical protein [Bacteriovoracaceae bacterium]
MIPYKFENFEKSFLSQNKLLKLSLLLLIIVFSLIIFFVSSKKSYFLYQGGEVFNERPLAVEVCKRAFDSIAIREPHPYFVHKEIIKLLENESFNVEFDEYFLAKSTRKDKCKLITKGKSGLRSFIVSLQGKDDFPFFYKLVQIDEVEDKENI